jgi:hypothetical protein
MDFVYVVVENGEAYPQAYRNYSSAVQAVHTRHQAELDRQIAELPDYKDLILADVQQQEDPSGTTFLYIEKEIRIFVHKLPVMNTAGGRSKRNS